MLRSICLAFCFFAFAAYSEERQLTDQDWADIRGVIEEQLHAFGRDDAETAFAFASPNIRRMFQTAANFVAMVKSEYQAVYRPRSMNFLKPALVERRVLQPIQLQDPDNTLVVAIYTMQRQADGAWKIDGCELAPGAGVYA